MSPGSYLLLEEKEHKSSTLSTSDRERGCSVSRSIALEKTDGIGIREALGKPRYVRAL